MQELKLIRPGEVRTRIAPSPTGPMHIGLARTALFNYLFSKKYQGSFILRIEDTDEERSEEKWEKEIIEGLKWLGINWQEGPEIEGAYGPYRQSERKEIYKRYIQKLLDEEKIYRCFCSREELEARNQYLLSMGQPPRYSGKCRDLSEKELKKNLKEKKPFVFRFKTPFKKVSFDDILRGKIEYDTENFGDMVVAKDFSEPLYNLACVIDDFEMKITHIIRGEDHISNTPKQILIAESLGISPPKYLHLPLILDSNRAKMSKRGEVKSVLEYKKEGYLPESLINFLVFLGWNPGTEREIFSLNSLIQEFFPEGIQKSGAVFNQQKLDWLNSFYIRQKSKEKFNEECLPYLIKAGFISKADSLNQKFIVKETNQEISFLQIQNITALYQERLKKISDIVDLADFFFKKELNYPKELLKWKDMEDEEIKDNLDKIKKVLNKIDDNDWTNQNIEEGLRQIEKGDRGKILWPLRVALSGKKYSAGPFEIAWALGKEGTMEKIENALKKI